MQLSARAIVKILQFVPIVLPLREFLGNTKWKCISCNQWEESTRPCVIITKLSVQVYKEHFVFTVQYHADSLCKPFHAW